MSVAKNTVINMGEDLTMMLGYSMVNKFLHEQLAAQFPPETDENGNEKMNIALEVLSGGASFLFMSAMMEVIRREERFIEYLFASGEAIISVLYLRNKGYFDGMMGKLRGLRGVKAKSVAKLASDNTDNQNSFINQVYQAMQAIMQGRSQGHDVANTISASNGAQDTAIRREGHNLKFAQANNQSFHDSVLIKTMTGTFTETDELILKKVIGRTNFQTTPINHEEMNKIREFMIVKDSSGKFIGLTEAFTSFYNALAFVKP